MAEKLARALLRPINTSGVIILGYYTLLWGIWLVMPWWSVFSTAPLFAIMAVLMPEWAWGTFAIAIGLGLIVATFKQHFISMTWVTLLTGWLWAAVSVFYFVADWQSTGGITSLMLAVYCAFVYLNIRVNKVLPNKGEGGVKNAIQTTKTFKN